jgi:hypothetical protein
MVVEDLTTLRTGSNEERYALLQGRSLLMLVVMLVYQLYQAFVASEWANPLVYLVLAVEVFCGGVVVTIGAARASDKQWLFRACTIALAVPWWMGILCMLNGFSHLASIPCGIYETRDAVGRLLVVWSFWRLLLSSLITGLFWIAVGNSLRKSVNGLGTKKPGFAPTEIVRA